MIGELGYMRAALAGGHAVQVRRPACLDILAGVFVDVVMKQPGSPRPLKGLPALNDLEAKGEEAAQSLALVTD